MNIYYDYQILYNQKYGGISRYFYDLINTIEYLRLANTSIKCKFSTNHYFAGYKGISETGAFLNIKSPIIRRSLRMWGHIINQSITKKIARDVEIMHLTYYNPYALKIPGVKKVVTVYDMIEEVKRKDSRLDQVIANKKECIYKADHVIAISESTKRDILRLYPDVNEDKVTVIYIGTSMMTGKADIWDKVNSGTSQMQEENGKDKRFPEKYILFVGQRGGYKNFDGFIKAVKPLLSNDKTLHLLCIGGGKFTPEELLMIQDVEDRIVQMDADDETLVAAYSNALCFVFPSFYEGFGIPTLEAFSCECPAVISNTSSMSEVGGDAALYFDPENTDEMRSQIEKVLTDGDIKSGLINSGRERMKLFSWEAIARQTVDCYKKVLADV